MHVHQRLGREIPGLGRGGLTLVHRHIFRKGLIVLPLAKIDIATQLAEKRQVLNGDRPIQVRQGILDSPGRIV